MSNIVLDLQEYEEVALMAGILGKARAVSNAVHIFRANPGASPNAAIDSLVAAVDRLQAFYNKQIDEGN